MNSQRKINATIIRRAAERASIPAKTKSLSAPSLAYEEEKTYLEGRRTSLEIDEIEEKLSNSRQDRNLRKKYADRAFTFLYFFASFSAIMLISQGIECLPVSKDACMKFSLPENVLVTLIGATAASVIGLVGWVARGLFKAPDK